MSKKTEIDEQEMKHRTHGDPRGSKRILAKRPHIVHPETTKASGAWDSSVKEDAGVAPAVSVSNSSIAPISGSQANATDAASMSAIRKKMLRRRSVREASYKSITQKDLRANLGIDMKDKTAVDLVLGVLPHELPAKKKVTESMSQLTRTLSGREYGKLPPEKVKKEKNLFKDRIKNALNSMRMNKLKVAEEAQVEEGKMAATLAHAVKQAKGIAFDKRYAAGNMTGAHTAISKLGQKYGIPGLEKHPEVKSALSRSNMEEEVDQNRIKTAGNEK